MERRKKPHHIEITTTSNYFILHRSREVGGAADTRWNSRIKNEENNS